MAGMVDNTVSVPVCEFCVGPKQSVQNATKLWGSSTNCMDGRFPLQISYTGTLLLVAVVTWHMPFNVDCRFRVTSCLSEPWSESF